MIRGSSMSAWVIGSTTIGDLYARRLQSFARQCIPTRAGASRRAISADSHQQRACGNMANGQRCGLAQGSFYLGPALSQLHEIGGVTKRATLRSLLSEQVLEARHSWCQELK
jgi:hypothetical protein